MKTYKITTSLLQVKKFLEWKVIQQTITHKLPFTLKEYTIPQQTYRTKELSDLLVTIGELSNWNIEKEEVKELSNSITTMLIDTRKYMDIYGEVEKKMQEIKDNITTIFENYTQEKEQKIKNNSNINILEAYSRGYETRKRTNKKIKKSTLSEEEKNNVKEAMKNIRAIETFSLTANKLLQQIEYVKEKAPATITLEITVDNINMIKIMSEIYGRTLLTTRSQSDQLVTDYYIKIKELNKIQQTKKLSDNTNFKKGELIYIPREDIKKDIKEEYFKIKQ